MRFNNYVQQFKIFRFINLFFEYRDALYASSLPFLLYVCNDIFISRLEIYYIYILYNLRLYDFNWL